ncbi:hypothetical protein OK016_16220 [Vibrio chagasii]|nr:hypothetical protein [Vibrio chagasii]
MELQDGSSGNPFFDDAVGTNKFTAAVATATQQMQAQTDGTKDGKVVDDTNIVTLLISMPVKT